MQRLADTFEGAVGEIVETVSSAVTELEASSNTLTQAAERGNGLATAVATASEEASANGQSGGALAPQHAVAACSNKRLHGKSRGPGLARSFT